MESNQGVPIDLVSIVQALVVLFIAAPPLVKTLTGLSFLARDKKDDDTPAGSAAPATEESDASTATVGTATPAAAGSHRASAPAADSADASKEA